MPLTRADVYKTPREHEVELPRTNDLAEITRSCCKAESGLIVQVVGEPHKCFAQCADCGAEWVAHFVEVTTSADYGLGWFKTPGPWFMPIDWLRRIDPRDPVQYARVLHYMPNWPTEQQMLEANKP